jgi:hypothetical protein
VASDAGDCVCSEDSTEIRGNCIKLAMLIPCILAPLFVMGLAAAYHYHQVRPLLCSQAGTLPHLLFVAVAISSPSL